ncbi:hypothetical protein RKD29_000098 [Streptomyces tendae]
MLVALGEGGLGGGGGEAQGEQVAPVVVLADDEQAAAFQGGVDVARVVRASGEEHSESFVLGQVVRLGEQFFEERGGTPDGQCGGRGHDGERLGSGEAGRLRPAQGGDPGEQLPEAVVGGDGVGECRVVDRPAGPGLHGGAQLAELGAHVTRGRAVRQVQYVDQVHRRQGQGGVHAAQFAQCVEQPQGRLAVAGDDDAVQRAEVPCDEPGEDGAGRRVQAGAQVAVAGRARGAGAAGQAQRQQAGGGDVLDGDVGAHVADHPAVVAGPELVGGRAAVGAVGGELREGSGHGGSSRRCERAVERRRGCGGIRSPTRRPARRVPRGCNRASRGTPHRCVRRAPARAGRSPRGRRRTGWGRRWWPGPRWGRAWDG